MASWRERLGDVAGSVVKAGVKIAAEQLPDELKGLNISPEAVAHLIVVADQNGLLNDPKAARLKAMAKRIEGGETPRPEDILDLVPDLMRTKIAEQVVPGAGNAEKIAKAAEAMAGLHRLGRMTGVIGGRGPAKDGGTPAKGSVAPTPPQETSPPAAGPGARQDPEAEPGTAGAPERPPRTRRTGPSQDEIADAIRRLRDQQLGDQAQGPGGKPGRSPGKRGPGHPPIQ